MLKFISRVFIHFFLKDLQFLRRRLLFVPVIHGPKERLHLGYQVDVMDTIFNTNSGNIHVGDNSFFGHGCMVLTGTHDPTLLNRPRQQDHPREGRDIKIGKGVWVSSGAIICGNVTIVDNAVIAAGAVVTKDCLEAAIYGGIPAVKLRALDIKQ